MSLDLKGIWGAFYIPRRNLVSAHGFRQTSTDSAAIDEGALHGSFLCCSVSPDKRSLAGTFNPYVDLTLYSDIRFRTV